jgi:hypothetical protein
MVRLIKRNRKDRKVLRKGREERKEKNPKKLCVLCGKFFIVYLANECLQGGFYI